VYALDPADPRRYRYRDGFEEMRVVKETIAVKGASPVEAELLFTRHGPLIFADEAPSRLRAAQRLAGPGTAPYFGSVGYMRARGKPVPLALRRWAPTENQVYADAAGNIGWVVGGLAPSGRLGHSAAGARRRALRGRLPRRRRAAAGAELSGALQRRDGGRDPGLGAASVGEPAQAARRQLLSGARLDRGCFAPQSDQLSSRRAAARLVRAIEGERLRRCRVWATPRMRSTRATS
jgi:hypothetical protein